MPDFLHCGSGRGLGAFSLAIICLMCAPFFPGGAEIFAQSPGGGPLFPMRHFVHVFVAFGLAWLLILLWVARITVLLARVQRRLGAAE